MAESVGDPFSLLMASRQLPEDGVSDYHGNAFCPFPVPEGVPKGKEICQRDALNLSGDVSLSI